MIRRLAILFLILVLIISPVVSAGSLTDTDDISYARNRVVDFFSNYDSSELVFVDGSELPVEDQAVFRFFKLQTSGIDKAETLKDTSVDSLDGLGKECVVVLGGPKTNVFGSSLLEGIENGSFVVSEEVVLAPYQFSGFIQKESWCYLKITLGTVLFLVLCLIRSWSLLLQQL